MTRTPSAARRCSCPAPFDRLYVYYVIAMCDYAAHETAHYADSMALFNAALDEYAKWHQRTNGAAVPSPGQSHQIAMNSAMRHRHANKAVLDGITAERAAAWDQKSGQAEATPAAAGLMSAADKKKLDGMAQQTRIIHVGGDLSGTTADMTPAELYAYVSANPTHRVYAQLSFQGEHFLMLYQGATNGILTFSSLVADSERHTFCAVKLQAKTTGDVWDVPVRIELMTQNIAPGRAAEPEGADDPHRRHDGYVRRQHGADRDDRRRHGGELLMQKLYEEAAVQDIADAIREKTGGAETYRIAQMGAAVRSIPGGDQIAHADIPDYVKDGVLALAQKVQAVKTASSIVFVTVADAHHATDESTGWKANIEAGNMDACRAIKALSHVTPLDFAAFLGDLTFGYKTTTAAQFEAQCREFHRWIEEGLRGIPQLWTPGNHDTGEYFASETGSLTNLYGAALIRKYFSDYNAGAVYGSAQAGYCYRDIPGKKLRIINLNTVEGEITGGETAANALSEAQLLWFAQTLADLGSKADSTAWGFVILGHYPLDWGSARAGGKVLKAYLDGGSVTIGGKTVSFAGKNGAVCYGNFHGHLHNFKTSRIYVVPDNVSQSDPPTQQMAALRICCPSANYYRTNEVGDNNRLDSNQIEFGEETTHSKAPGVTDTAFTVNVINPADKKIYSFCYGAGYDRTLSFDFAVVMRTVKAMLTGCSGSNAATAVEDGAAYTTTLTPKNGYTFDTVTVSMGGTDITATAYNAATGVVSIARVTGDITITATASKPVTYTNLVPTAVDSSGASMPYQNGYNLSSSGNAQSGSGFVTTGFIPLPGNVTKHIYRIAGEGIVFSKAEAYSRVGWYDSTFQLLKTVIPANKIDVSVYFPSSIPESTTAMTFQVTEAASNVPASAAYFRVSAMGKGENLIITLDEPIE